MIRKFIQYSFILCLIISGCQSKKDKKNDNLIIKQKLEIKYAKGFDIEYFNNIKKLIIKHPYPKANEQLSYTFSKTNDSTKSHIQTPLKRIVVTSTTHIPMLELLNEETSLVGFQNTKYVSSEKTRKLIDNGTVQELGKETAMNTELLFELQPDLVLGFAMTKTNKTYNQIEENGIPVVINGDWLEETPLGRAEWIKVFGLLFDKEKEADSIFKSIEANYLAAKKLVSATKNSPSILSGAIMSKDIWNLPAGESFVAQYLTDANVNYLWKESKGKGSLSLSFESVFDKGQEADFWIAPGYFTTKDQMLKSNDHYKNFKAFKNNKIYTPSTKTGATGGVVYYELAPTRPDLVLKDIIKITHPELLPNYTLTFFEKMN